MADQAAKLEQYIALAKSARGESAAKLIVNAISAPGIYVFGELLDQPSIQDLANTSHADHLALLQLFAFGTLADYNASSDSVPTLNDTQLLKLKHLTLVSLALRNRSIPYQTISEALQLDSIRELEDLIIDVMYAGLLGGKMHHDEKILHIDWVSGRDVNPESLQEIASSLERWCQTSRTLLTGLDDQITYLRQQNADDATNRENYEAARNAAFIKATKGDAKKEHKPFPGYLEPPPPGYDGQGLGYVDTGALGFRGDYSSSQEFREDGGRVSKRHKSDEMEVGS